MATRKKVIVSLITNLIDCSTFLQISLHFVQISFEEQQKSWTFRSHFYVNLYLLWLKLCTSLFIMKSSYTLFQYIQKISKSKLIRGSHKTTCKVLKSKLALVVMNNYEVAKFFRQSAIAVLICTARRPRNMHA